MNGAARFGDQMRQPGFCGEKSRFDARPRTMHERMTAFMIAVGGTSLVCLLLIERVQNRGARRRERR